MQALPTQVLQVADEWWARDFACEVDELRPAHTHVQEHAGRLGEETGIWILCVGEHPLISLPSSLMSTLAEQAATWSRAVVADEAALLSQLAPVEVRKIVGPAFIGYGTTAQLDLASASVARELTADDATAITALRAACSEEEWEHGGSDIRHDPCFGAHDESGELCALAGYKLWDAKMAHISIVTTPERRHRGYATAAVASAASHALAHELYPQYRTLASNQASMRIARRLGFLEYGFSVYVKLASS